MAEFDRPKTRRERRWYGDDEPAEPKCLKRKAPQDDAGETTEKVEADKLNNNTNCDKADDGGKAGDGNKADTNKPDDGDKADTNKADDGDKAGTNKAADGDKADINKADDGDKADTNNAAAKDVKKSKPTSDSNGN